MDSSNLVNVSIITYISFTFLFFVLKFRFFPENNYVWILTFLMFTCVIQYVQNLNITSSPDMCGHPDPKIAFYSTVVPWTVVFTLFTMLMISSPGWLRVFSNTFGLFAADAFGIEEIIQRVIQKPMVPMSKDYEYLKMLENIYSDRMALVVELNLEDVKDEPGKFEFPGLDKLEALGLIEPLKGKEGNDLELMIKARKDLYGALLLKDNVGFFFWFLLMGIFCILISTNTILSSNCSPKVGKTYDSIFS